MKLSAALGVAPREIVALVGAGGKTSALYRLAHELLATDRRVLATTTTHMRAPEPSAGWPLVVEPEADACLAAAAHALAHYGRVLVAAGRTPEGKLRGVPPAAVPGLAALADVTLVEADGARGLHLKAPAGHEPVIPTAATLVVPVVGLQALGSPLGSGAVHRPERVGALLGLPQESCLCVEHLAALLLNERGGLQGVPARARVVPLVNQADTPALRQAGRRVAQAVLRARWRVRQAVVASLQAAPEDCERWQPSAAVVLAAGAARRYGRLKQLEAYEGRPFALRVLEAALGSLATDCLAVLGCGAPTVAALLAGRAHLLHNPHWGDGLSTSVRTALQGLAQDVQAAVFLQADQPLLTPEQIDGLLTRHAATGASVVAWRYQGEARPPMLFSRTLFAELATLSGDVGGRAILGRHTSEAEYVEAQDPRPHADVDTPEDLQRLSHRPSSQKAGSHNSP